MPSNGPIPEKPRSDELLDRLRFARRWAQHHAPVDTIPCLTRVTEALRDEHRPMYRPSGTPSAGRELEALLLAKLPKPIGPLTDDQKPGSFSVSQSLNCLRDEVRTKTFLAAIRGAVQKLAPHRDRIEVVDAGCGAAPILSIYAALQSPLVHVTALELNPAAAKIARDIVRGFGLHDRITVEECDATRYHAPRYLDLIISETMHTGLTEEPLVQILNQLCRFRSEGSIVIPAAVTVYAGVIPIAGFFDRDHECVVDDLRLLTLRPTWMSHVRYEPGDDLQEIVLEFHLDRLLPGAYAVVVGSTVQVSPDIELKENQSLISSPTNALCGTRLSPHQFTIVRARDLPPSAQMVRVRYAPGKTPFGWIVGK